MLLCHLVTHVIAHARAKKRAFKLKRPRLALMKKRQNHDSVRRKQHIDKEHDILQEGETGVPAQTTGIMSVGVTDLVLEGLVRSEGRLGGWGGVRADGLVGLLVHLLHVVEGDLVLDVRGEVLLVLGLVLLGEVLHVLGHVRAVDTVAVEFRLKKAVLKAEANAARNSERGGGRREWSWFGVRCGCGEVFVATSRTTRERGDGVHNETNTQGRINGTSLRKCGSS